MAEPSYPDINGTRYDFSSITVDIAGGYKPVGVTEINYSHGLDRGDVRGTSPERLGRTRGQYTPEASITMYEAEWKVLRDKLGDGYLEKVFSMSVTYADDGQPTITDVIEGCTISNVEKGRSAGNEAATVALTLHVIRITEDGKKPINRMRT
jgi:hypothetical protein